MLALYPKDMIFNTAVIDYNVKHCGMEQILLKSKPSFFHDEFKDGAFFFLIFSSYSW